MPQILLDPEAQSKDLPLDTADRSLPDIAATGSEKICRSRFEYEVLAPHRLQRLLVSPSRLIVMHPPPLSRTRITHSIGCCLRTRSPGCAPSALRPLPPPSPTLMVGPIDYTSLHFKFDGDQPSGAGSPTRPVKPGCSRFLHATMPFPSPRESPRSSRV
jgi:hypothetical protein